MPALKNKKWEAFARGLVAGKSGATAYADAGYKPNRRSASTLRHHPDVIERVDELTSRAVALEEVTTQQALERACVTKLAIVQELKLIGFARMDDFIVTDANGQPFLDLNNTPKDKFAAIKQITVKEYYDEKRDQTVRETKFELHDKKGALLDLARFHGMTNDRANLQPTLIQINLSEADLRA